MVLPEGIVSSGAPAIVSTCERLEIYLDPWQRDAATAILAKNRNGMYAADLVVLSIARQVGKTFLVGAIIFADCIANPGTLTVWTAHRFKVARESFDELRALAESEAMAPHVDKEAITTAAGNEVIPFRNGSRIVFAARERGSIRGFRKVRRLVLDEAQILSDAVLSDLAPTQNQARNPQIILMGTPPKPSDPSEAFTRLRAEALTGESEGVAYIEYAADPNSDLDDREAWATANPSYPSRTPERALLRLRRLLDDDDFMREVMGVWTAEQQAASALDLTRWMALADVKAQPRKPLVFGVDLGEDRTASIGAAWRRPGGLQVMLGVAPDGRLDVGLSTAAVVERLVELCERWSGRVVLGGPAAALELDLRRRGVLVSVLSGSDFAAACGQVADRVADGSLWHGNQDELNASVHAARWRTVGSAGERAWQLKGAVGISPLAAVTRAAAATLARPERVLEPVAVLAPPESSGLSSMQF